MAQCKDCIHEKVCLHKANIETDTYAYMGIKYDTEKCKHYTSADVVPKSEVYGFTAEELAQKCESLSIELEAMRTSANSYKMHYENAKQEVAREIFEEMEKNSKFTIQFVEDMEFDSEEIRKAKLECYRDCMGYFQKLKKKYTEGER